MKYLLTQHKASAGKERKESGTPQEKDKEGKTMNDYLDDLLQVCVVAQICIPLCHHSGVRK